MSPRLYCNEFWTKHSKAKIETGRSISDIDMERIKFVIWGWFTVQADLKITFESYISRGKYCLMKLKSFSSPFLRKLWTEILQYCFIEKPVKFCSSLSPYVYTYVHNSLVEHFRCQSKFSLKLVMTYVWNRSQV